MNDAHRKKVASLWLRRIEDKKEDCPDCYKKWEKMGALQMLRRMTKAEVEEYLDR